MWEQVGVTAAAVRGPRTGTPSPAPCPHTGAGLRQRLSSRGRPTVRPRQEPTSPRPPRLPGKMKDGGELGVVRTNATKKIFSLRPPAQRRHAVPSQAAGRPTAGCGLRDAAARLSLRALSRGAERAPHHSELRVTSRGEAPDPASSSEHRGCVQLACACPTTRSRLVPSHPQHRGAPRWGPQGLERASSQAQPGAAGEGWVNARTGGSVQPRARGAAQPASPRSPLSWQSEQPLSRS